MRREDLLWLARRRRRRIDVHRFVQFVLNFAGGFFEFLDALAEAAGEFGKFFGAEKDENNGKDGHDFHAVEQSKNWVHKAYRLLRIFPIIQVAAAIKPNMITTTATTSNALSMAKIGFITSGIYSVLRTNRAEIMATIAKTSIQPIPKNEFISFRI